jgi:CheY-like chemotaxis protein
VLRDPPPERLTKWIPPGTDLYRAVGCPDCAMTGYRGRFSILEVLMVTPDVERRVAAGETADRISQAAQRAGMASLWLSGVSHVLHGESTIEELQRVVDVPVEREERLTPPEPVRRSPAAGAPAAAPRHSPAAGTAVIPEAPPPTFELLDEPEGPRPGGGSGPVRKILLVDDEDSLRKVLRDLLEREGYEIAEARDGVQALDQVDRVGPDVIVLDLNLPGLDGYTVLSRLRSRPATAGIPVIVLTAKGDEDNEVRVFELGADDFLQKPFRARALAARLEVVLGRRRSA